MARQFIQPEEIEMDMTPMIDVTFQLIIFFVLTMKVRREEGKLEAFLPKDKGQRAVQHWNEKKDLEDIRVKLIAVGSGEVEVQVGEKSLGPASSNHKAVFKGLEASIRGLMGEAGQPVVIDGDSKVAFKYVVWALDSAIAAGAKEINFTVPDAAHIQ